MAAFNEVKTILYVFLALPCLALQAQPNSAIPTYIRASNTLDRLTSGLTASNILYGIPLPPGKIIGDTYLNKEWRKSTLMLYGNDKLIEGYLIRYDLFADEIEIKTPDGIRVLVGRKVKSFLQLDSATNLPSYFVNALDYKNEKGIPLSGFFEVLSEGQLTLFKQTVIRIKKADYNAALNVGSRDDKMIRTEELYFLHQHKLSKAPSSKKKLMAFFGDRAIELAQFIDANSLVISNESHLNKIVERYNSLTPN